MMARLAHDARRYRRPALVGLIVIGAAAVLWSVEQWQQDRVRRITGSTMGTTYTVSYRSDAIPPAKLKPALTSKLDAIDRALSNWNDDSWLSRFNRRESTRPMAMPEHAHRVLSIALRLAKRTDGAVDPTLGRLIDLWGFGPAPAPEGRPADTAIAKALETTGYQKLTLHDDPPRLAKAHPGLALNVSAVAKGYAVDVLARHLEQAGIAHYLVNIGGDMRAKGRPPDQRAWRVAIQRPAPDASARQSEVEVNLKNEALATSGDYRRFITIDGKRYAHVLNPATGRPARSSLASVSVIAPTAAKADGLATACLVFGRRKAHKRVNTMSGVDALLIERTAPGRFRLHRTGGWNRRH
jgi:thiamine biosynthesis lipoprotein